MSRTATAPVDRVKLLLQVQDVGPALTIRDGFHRMAAEGALLEHPLPRLGKWSGVWAHPWNERALQRRAKRKAALALSGRVPASGRCTLNFAFRAVHSDEGRALHAP